MGRKIALFVGLAGLGVALAALADAVAGGVRADVAAVLTEIASVDQRPRGMSHDIGEDAGQRFIAAELLAGVVAAGIPLALVGAGLSARAGRTRRRWSGWWTSLALIGFSVQLSSLALTTVIVLTVILTSSRGGSFLVRLFFLLNIVCGAFGVRAWRTLYAGGENL